MSGFNREVQWSRVTTVRCIFCGTEKEPDARCTGCAANERNRISNSLNTSTPSGALTSRAPRFDLLPRRALERIASRYEKGLARYGKDNWRKGLSDREYIVERITHVIAHCYRLIDKIEGRLQDDDDDAGAIGWGGMFVCEATNEKGQVTNDLRQA